MGSLLASLAVLLANLEYLFAKSRSLLVNLELTEKMRRFPRALSRAVVCRKEKGAESQLLQ